MMMRTNRLLNYRMNSVYVVLWLLLMALVTLPAHAEKRKVTERNSLTRYLASLQREDISSITNHTSGSLFSDDSPFLALAADAKAHRLHDLITVIVSEQTFAHATGDVGTQRNYSGSSAITALGAHIGTGGVNPLFAANSSTSLKGKGESNSNSNLQTTLAAEVVALLPNNNLVVEATRSVKMNNELRTFVLRGIVRPADVSPSNAVNSSDMAHLEIELRGKGVVSDGTRPNNIGIRWLWKVLGF